MFGTPGDGPLGDAYLVPQFPYQKKVNLFGFSFFSRKTNHKKRLKVKH